MVTKLEKKSNLKTTRIHLEGEMKVSNEFFSPGAADEELNMLPIPYKSSRTIDGRKQEVTEVMCVWRAYIIGSSQEIRATAAKTNDYDLMLKMMKGNSI